MLSTRLPLSLTPRRLRLLAWVLVGALLWLQWLGQMHRVRHLPPLAQAQATSSVADAQPHAGWLAHVQAASGDPVECRLYDQLGVADLLWAVPAGLPALRVPQAMLWRAHAQPACAPARFFAARGPPPVR